MILSENFGELSDKATQQLIAPVFLTLYASVPLSTGDLFIFDNKLYKTTTDIAQDAAITIGSGGNAVEASTVAEELQDADSSILNTVSEITDNLKMKYFVASYVRSAGTAAMQSYVSANEVVFLNSADMGLSGKTICAVAMGKMQGGGQLAQVEICVYSNNSVYFRPNVTIPSGISVTGVAFYK